MKKKWRIFFFVIYFLFTFVLGFFIALVLPQVNYNILKYEKLNEYIETQQFVNAMDLVGGLYNKEPIFHEKYDEDSGIIIFEANSFYVKTIKDVENDITTEIQYINNSYICFLYGIDEKEKFNHESLNVSRVVINSNEALSIELDSYYELLEMYTVNTLINSNYIYIPIDEIFCTENNLDSKGIYKIEIYDANNIIYKSVNLEANLNFNSEYFKETEKFVDIYNQLFVLKGPESEKTESEKNEQLENTFKEINEKYPSCIKSGSFVHSDIKKEADKESTIFVLIYFIWVYILGDFLVGPRYILRFLTFLFRKIVPKKVKTKEETVEPTLGFGFISTLNIEVKVPEGLQEDIVVEYEHSVNPDYNFKTVITRTVDYKKKERVHGGSYKLVSATCHGFEVVNLPEKLEVKGYAMKLSFEIKHENN